jgi:translation initiation factor 2B subunit (eIF-2B alpha/beta/delta family)
MVLGVLLGAAERGCHFSVVVAESHARGRGHATAAALSSAGVPVAMIEDCAVAHAMDSAQLALCGAEAVVESGGVISQTGTYQIAIVASACKKPFYVAAESTKFARKFPLSQLDVPAKGPSREHAAYVGRSPPPETLRVEVCAQLGAFLVLYPSRPPTNHPPQFNKHASQSANDMRRTEASATLRPFFFFFCFATSSDHRPPPSLPQVTSRDYTPPHYITMLFTDLGVLTPSAVSDELIKLFT